MSDSEEFDWGVFRRECREDSQERRSRNRNKSREILEKRGVDFEAKNDGAHLIVRAKGSVVDFWPGTGKYIFRTCAREGRGVFGLLRAIDREAGE